VTKKWSLREQIRLILATAARKSPPQTEATHRRPTPASRCPKLPSLLSLPLAGRLMATAAPVVPEGRYAPRSWRAGLVFQFKELTESEIGGSC